jgi:hypothetical protein
MAMVLTQTKPQFSDVYTEDGYYFNSRDNKWYAVTSSTETNDDGTIDFSNATEVVGGLGIIGKTYIDADGGAERVEQLPRESYADIVKGKRVECNELGFTPVVYSGYLSASETTVGTILTYTDIVSNGISVTAGIGIIEEDGLYSVGLTALVRHNSTAGIVDVDINIGSNVIRLLDNGDSTNGYTNAHRQTIVRLYKGDTIYAITESSDANNYLIGGFRKETQLNIQKIGE